MPSSDLAAAIAALAPTGVLRAAINLGNPILAGTDPDTGAPVGVSVDLARNLAGQLGVALELTVVGTAAESVAAVTSERADVGFFAVDPARGAGIAFTAPYVLIEGCYLVAERSALQHNDDVDRTGVRVVVGAGSAYDLYLTRSLQHAEIVRVASSQAVVQGFVAQGLDVAAGVKQQLQADAAHYPGHRLLPGCFMVIPQAMGLPKGRGHGAHALLQAFVERMKAEGEVAAALARHGVEGASVAPPG